MVVNKVFVARHGERIDHIDRTWKARVGNPDDPFLTEVGLAQARCLGRRLASENISKIFVSPFYRTLQTAAAVADIVDAPMHVEPGMCEALLPDWFPAQPRLKALSAVQTEFPRVVSNYQAVHHSLWPETKESCGARVFKTARTLAQRESGNILLVGHGITCENAGKALLDLETMPFIAYCALMEIVSAGAADNGDLRYRWGAVQEPDISFFDDDVRPATRCIKYA